MKVLRHGKATEESADLVEHVASAIAATMFAPHELPLPDDLWEKYKGTARAAIEACRAWSAELLSTRLRAEAAEAAHAKDKARLDFLDRANAVLNARYKTVYRWKLIMNHNVNRLLLGSRMEVDLNDAEANGLPSCRDAIDEQMARIAATTEKAMS